MKKALFCILAIFTCVGAFSQERIAVFPFEDLDNILTRNESVIFYREFSNEFTNRSVGKFNVIPRQEVEKLINTEAAFQLSDFSSRTKTAEMERVLNGTQILSGVIGKVGTRLTISISLYTYPELVQQPGGTTLRVANIDELFDKIPELVQSMQNNIVSTLPPAPAYRIGDRGPGGGFIFFAENGVFMECSIEIGSYTYDAAVSAARNYRGGGLNDWRLPRQDELRIMYSNLKLKGLGGVFNGNYWMESDRQRVYYLSFNNGQVGSVLKNENNSFTVRAVRTF
jgi:TolB-like protein